MKALFAIGIMALLAFVPLTSQAHEGHEHAPSVALNHIDAKTLKEWMDAGKKMILLDARTREYDDGRRIPGAVWMPFNTSEELLAQAIGSKEATVVSYCWSTKCPASGWLAERLTKYGYTQVYEFSGGLEEWANAGYPVSKA